MNLNDFLPNNTFGAMLIFARIGTALMLLPGFGEVYVPQRYRLLFALIFSGLLLPVLSPILPPLPANTSDLVVALGSELIIGAFIGTMTRIILAALQTAGMIVSMQTGLSYAQVFNPIEASQDSLPSSFYAILGVLMIFLTNTHHLMLRGLVDSYAVFQPGHLPPVEDLSSTMTHAVSASFKLAMEMAAPFVVLGTIFFIALGLIGRLVPQLQILFITQPLQILGGLMLMGLLAATGIGWFLQSFSAQFLALIPS